MNKILKLPFLIIFSFLTFENSTELKTVNETEYEKNVSKGDKNQDNNIELF